MSFSRLELALIVAFTALVTWAIVSPKNPLAQAWDPELAQYEERYGPDKASAGPEEWLVRDFFRDRRDGYFVDVGAGHYWRDSNTYFLETALGWHGLAIDGLEDYRAGYEQHRSGTRFLTFFVSDRSGHMASLYVNPLDKRLSSSDRSVPASRGPTLERQVPTITLNDLLEREEVERIDFLSMDIELSEPAALKGFDPERYRPELICVEAHLQVREELLHYFARRGYVPVGRYLRADRANLYFTPLPPEMPRQAGNWTSHRDLRDCP